MPESTGYSDNTLLKDKTYAPSFRVFYELMKKRVNEILLISSPYDAFIMEEDGRIAERILHEYRGLNLTRPPRFTWVSSMPEAINALHNHVFDLIILMPLGGNQDPYVVGKELMHKFPDIPVILLAHDTGIMLPDIGFQGKPLPGRLFIWRGNTDLMLAIIKSMEDLMNVDHDTRIARVRVIILVEDSPQYLSSLLPLLYREIVLQTQAVMGDSLNESHRILRMRARPKILIAQNFEEAEDLYRRYKAYLLSVFSDVRFCRKGRLDDSAGFAFLDRIRTENPGLPLLMLSSEDSNRDRARNIPAVFQNKNSSSLHDEIRSFLINHLAFGDFVFRMPDGTEVARASSLSEMEKMLPFIPDESVCYHAKRDHFSTWLMARSEIQLASKLRPVHISDFSDHSEIKKYLIESIRENRKSLQEGIVTDFKPAFFKPDTEFLKIGNGSLGGKGRGLAFMATLINRNRNLQKQFSGVQIRVPQTLVVSTQGFDSFLDDNNLKDLANIELDDKQITEEFLTSDIPEWLVKELEQFLSKIKYPLAVRSSSLLEDSQSRPFAGLYNTYMIPNDSPDMSVRLKQLIQAVKLVYASTYLDAPKSFSKSLQQRIEEEKMAVIVQQLTGNNYGGYFFPGVSGVAQSYNFYPISHMKPEDGIAHIAFGLGKTVVEGGNALRFSPRYPQLLPQFSGIDDILKHAQRHFFALKTSSSGPGSDTAEKTTSTPAGLDLERLEISEIEHVLINHSSIGGLFSTYIAEDHKIRDSLQPGKGIPVLTFNGILKYNQFPLPEILQQILEIGQNGMGSPVEIEFAVNFPEDAAPEFTLLQIRPMVVWKKNADIDITEGEIKDALCFSNHAMSNGTFPGIRDIIFVKPDQFDPAYTREIAYEIGKMNKTLVKNERKYLLAGPGRWGSADRWLGIPVDWQDISGIGAIIETHSDKLHAEPSHGTHFFHNITSLGICYLTIKKDSDDFIDNDWLDSLPTETETPYLKHLCFDDPLTIKVAGKKSRAVILKQKVNT